MLGSSVQLRLRAAGLGDEIYVVRNRGYEKYITNSNTSVDVALLAFFNLNEGNDAKACNLRICKKYH